MRNTLSRALCLAVAISLLPAASAVGAVVNGDFEGPGTVPWFAINGPAPCDPAAVVRPLALGEGGTHVAWMGDWPFTPGQPGCDPTAIFQVFDCDSTEVDVCTVEFDSLFLPLDPGELAFVFMRTPGGWGLWLIPPGFLNDVEISLPNCDFPAVIAFGLVNGGGAVAGTQSILLIDNVESACADTVVDLDSCTGPYCDAIVALFDEPLPEDPLLAAGEDAVSGACCGRSCLQLTDELCASLAPDWKYRGDGTLCEEECPDGVPAVSEWGLAALTLLVLAAGTVVLLRRRTAVV